MKNLLITFSGGRTSAFLCKYILTAPEYKDYKKLFVYANTGKELEKTLEFVDKCDKEFGLNLVWIEADVTHEKGVGTEPKIVTFETASRNGEPFEEVIKKYGLPSKVYKHCTRELKEVPLHKFAKNEFSSNEYLTAIGIRADEAHRVGNDKKIIYPLVMDFPVDEKFIRGWWKLQSFDLGIKDYEGNCDLCYLKSTRKKKTILSEDETVAEWWNQMEEKHSKDDRTIFDEHRGFSIKDLVELSKLPFTKAHDKQELRDSQSSLFDSEDIEYDCFCKMN